MRGEQKVRLTWATSGRHVYFVDGCFRSAMQRARRVMGLPINQGKVIHIRYKNHNPWGPHWLPLQGNNR